MFAALVGLVLISFCGLDAACYEHGPGIWRVGRAGVIALAALVVAVGIAGLLAQPEKKLAAAASNADGWEVFSEQRLAAALDAGQPVFVDFTAAWCVTCKVNEMRFLSQPSVEHAFSSNGIVTMRADWTNRDPEIAAVLASHGRVGVPLYLFYPAEAETPTILPQILSETVVISALTGSSH